MVTKIDDDHNSWAHSEMRNAQLGNVQRTRRAIAMLVAMADRPSGRISESFATSAARQGAYGIVENSHFDHEQLAHSIHIATALRASMYREVIVPIDGTGLGVAHRGPSFGPVSGKDGCGGAHAMTSLVLSLDGVALGIGAQKLWTRSATHSPAYPKDLRLIEDRETGYWIKNIEETCAIFAAHAPTTRPWFVLDRGGDCAAVIDYALQQKASLTVRSCYNRCVRGGKLWAQASRAPYLGSYKLSIRTRERGVRIATVHVRARPVELQLRLGVLARGAMRKPTMWVVEARESGRAKGRILWRLLTTKPANTFARASAVIASYALRWRIEEFHRAWKSGACDIENSWLRKPEHFYKWATLSGAVAARIERLKFLSRQEPQRPAVDEFTRDEIDAAIVLRKPKGIKRGASPTIGEMTRWIADLGGYTGKSSGGPPGTVVIARGMLQIATAAAVFASIRIDPDKLDQ